MCMKGGALTSAQADAIRQTLGAAVHCLFLTHGDNVVLANNLH